MTDETKKILVKALEQLVVYAKNDKTLSWNWDRKTEGQYRLEIIVDTSNPLERVVKPTLAKTANRLVVIDHRTKHDRLENFGRIIDAWDVKIELDLQDDNRTLKVFITD